MVCDLWKWHAIQISVSIILLEHRHAHLFMYCLGLLSQYNSELSSCDRDHMASKAQNIYYLAFYRKSLLIPGLHHSENSTMFGIWGKVWGQKEGRKEGREREGGGLERGRRKTDMRMNRIKKGSKESHGIFFFFFSWLCWVLVVVCRLRCPVTSGILVPHQGLNLCPLQWEADS